MSVCIDHQSVTFVTLCSSDRLSNYLQILVHQMHSLISASSLKLVVRECSVPSGFFSFHVHIFIKMITSYMGSLFYMCIFLLCRPDAGLIKILIQEPLTTGLHSPNSYIIVGFEPTTCVSTAFASKLLRVK